MLISDSYAVAGDLLEGFLLGGDLGVDMGELGGTALGVEEKVEAEVSEPVLTVPAAGRRVVPHAGGVRAETAEGLYPLHDRRLLDVHAHHHRPVREKPFHALQRIVTPVSDNRDAAESDLLQFGTEDADAAGIGDGFGIRRIDYGDMVVKGIGDSLHCRLEMYPFGLLAPSPVGDRVPGRMAGYGVDGAQAAACMPASPQVHKVPE